MPDFVMAIEALPKISRTRSADPLEQRVGEGLVIVPVPLVISEGPRYTDIQILRAGRTKKSEQRNEKQSQKRTHTEKESIHNQKQPRTKQSTQTEKQAIPTTKAENQNYTHEKEATRVLHPAPRLTPENGGIPPFYGRNKLNVRVLCRYR